MTSAKKPTTELIHSLQKAQLVGAIKILRKEGAASTERQQALSAIQELEDQGKPALLLIVAAFLDTEEAVRFHAFTTFQHVAAEDAGDLQSLGQLLASSDHEVRLEAVRRLVRISPSVHTARAKNQPGWSLLRKLLYKDRSTKEGQMIRSHTLDEATFLKALPTQIRNLTDPVVQIMRANPGKWIVWNEATRQVVIVTDDFNLALANISQPEDPNILLDMAPGFPREAAIHGPRELLPWESPNVIDDVHLLWGRSADAFLDCPNPRFDGRKPRDLVGTEDEVYLRDMLRAVRYGATS